MIYITCFIVKFGRLLFLYQHNMRIYFAVRKEHDKTNIVEAEANHQLDIFLGPVFWETSTWKTTTQITLRRSHQKKPWLPSTQLQRRCASSSTGAAAFPLALALALPFLQGVVRLHEIKSEAGSHPHRKMFIRLTLLAKERIHISFGGSYVG
jgi:hypothetical protein